LLIRPLNVSPEGGLISGIHCNNLYKLLKIKQGVNYMAFLEPTPIFIQSAI